MPNTREKLTREMTFEEEAKYYEAEARAEFAKETGYGEGSMVNNILRRGMRIIRKARQEIANGVTVNEWISVKDRLPDTAERVLVCKTWLGRVYKPEYGYYQDFPNSKGCWYVLTEFGYYPQREVTHWMPLPTPPKGE